MHTLETHPEEINQFNTGPLIYEDLPEIPVWKTNETVRQSTDTFREKRALGLLLSGLAQIFGYTVTPVQIASLSNPNVTRPVTMPMMKGNVTKQQAASSASMNSTTPRLQETIRFTGVLNFGNNSDIIGHLQRYEQIFHGRGNNMTGTMTKPAPMPMPGANVSVDPRTNTRTKAPLLAPFFVKIPLPIAPNLPPATLPIGDFKVSYPAPIASFVSGSNENTETTPVRKEQETVYRSNEDSERYTVEEKDIYDEKDVGKGNTSKYNHQLYIDSPNYDQTENDGYNKTQQRNRDEDAYYKEDVEKQQYDERLKEQEEQGNRDKDAYYNEDEEKYRNREEVSNKRPTYNDEEDENSTERYEEHASRENNSDQFSKQPAEKEEDESENSNYSNYNENNDPNAQFNGYKYPNSYNKYIEVGYNPELPIGDYFHEGNPEAIRDSYGAVLDNKKQEDDRLSGYFSMFKHPYMYDSEEMQNPEDASKENAKQTSAAHGYNEHLDKLRDEYALPENKYEEYDINDGSEADRNDRESGRIQNRTSARTEKLKTNRPHSAKDNRAKTSNEANRNEEVPRENIAKSEEEIDFVRYTSLIIPVRYIDASDKVQQAMIQQRRSKESVKPPQNEFPEGNVDSTVSKEKLSLPGSLPEKPQQLHEGERKELQVWPPPFDYVFDNTEPVNTVVLPDSQSYSPNYEPTVKNIPANDADNDSSSGPPSGYVVVIGNPVHPYTYPYNVYYFPNEAANAYQNPHLNVEGAYVQDQVYVPQQGANQQALEANPNITGYNLIETAKDFRNYYYQPQTVPVNHLNRYRYIFEEHISRDKEAPNVDIGSQTINTENWSSKIHRPRDGTIQRSSIAEPIQLQNAGSSRKHVRNESPAEEPRYSQPPRRRRKNPRPEDQRRDDGKMIALSQPSIRRTKPVNDSQSTHEFVFGFRRTDNSVGSESSNASRITAGNNKSSKKSGVLIAPEPIAYHRNESPIKHVDEVEHIMEKAREHRNKVTTLGISEQGRLRTNGPSHYVNFMRDV